MTVFPQHSTHNFWRQHIQNFERQPNRIPLFLNLIASRTKTLHVGCADWPIYNPSDNLHCTLVRCFGKTRVDGFDVDEQTIAQMRKHPMLVGCTLHSGSMDSIAEASYDCVLAPETIEHVSNMQIFLTGMDRILAPGGILVLTAPNAFSPLIFARNQWMDEGRTFAEVVHPDHNCWFSMYTLANVMRKHVSGYRIDRVGVVEPDDTSVFVVATKMI